MKQVEMKDKIQKEELDNYSRQNTLAETLSKEEILVLSPSLDIRDPFNHIRSKCIKLAQNE